MNFSVATLGELSLGDGKYGIAASAVDYDAELPAYLRITDINDDGTLNWNDRKSVDDPAARKYMLSEGDIVFARTGNSTGRNYYYDPRDGTFAFAGFLIRFSLDDRKVNPRYIKYYAQSKAYWSWVASFNTGSTRGNINAKTYAQMPIPLPDRPTQDSIVTLCDSISNKIRLNTKLNGYLLELMNVQYQHSFCCNKLTLGSIYDIADVVYGAAFKSALFNEEKVGYPLIRIRDLSTFSPQYWTNEAHPKRVFVHPGDVLAGMDAEFTPCLWQGEMAVLNQRVCLFEPAANSGVSRSYLLMALNPLLAFIQNYASGTTVAHMGKGDLEALNVPIPARGDLERFNTIAEPLREQIVQNSTQNRKLAALRDALLPKLMSGEIDVSRVDFTQLNSHLLHYVQRAVHTVAIVLDERNSVETVINTVLSEMQGLLDPHQLKHLTITLRRVLGPKQTEPGQDLLALFLTAKEVEGCSPKTIAYYEATLRHMNTALAKPYTQVESNDLRRYLNDYEVKRGSSKVTIDNIRRIMSSFFSWLEDEDYIVKSPVRRIRRVKTAQVTKEVLSDEELEVLRDACESKRDLAIVDLLASTGMRIGELVRLDRKDVNLHERECLVMGKGNKQRPVYFDARAKLHLTEYLSSRADKSPALFVALDSSARRITVGSIELRLRDLGRSAGINRVHPHKFRRTLATHAIDKGMPIEQVQKLLGHAKIDTTMYYAMVNQSNVKASHRKYLE